MAPFSTGRSSYYYVRITTPPPTLLTLSGDDDDDLHARLQPLHRGHLEAEGERGGARGDPPPPRDHQLGQPQRGDQVRALFRGGGHAQVPLGAHLRPRRAGPPPHNKPLCTTSPFAQQAPVHNKPLYTTSPCTQQAPCTPTHMLNTPDRRLRPSGRGADRPSV
eukprot:1118330-Prorocentrum_minimum.AAC.1